MHLSSTYYVGCLICCIIGAARPLYFALTIVQVLLWINYLPELKNPNLPTQAPAAPSDDLLQLQGNPFANMMNGELGSAVQDITMKRYLNNEFFSSSSSSKLCPTSHFKLRVSCRWVPSWLIDDSFKIMWWSYYQQLRALSPIIIRDSLELFADEFHRCISWSMNIFGGEGRAHQSIEYSILTSYVSLFSPSS